MPNKYTLYGAQLSLYTGKTRAYLRYKNIPFNEVFSSVRVYEDVIIPNTGVRFIPVVETPEHEFIQDTSAIIDALEKRFPARSVIPNTPKQRLISAILEMWGDECLLIPAMHYRWNHNNFPFIYEEFGSIVFPRMPAFIRRFVGKKLATKFKGFVPRLGITEKSIPAIEHWYEQQILPALDAHFAKYDYLLGGRACVGDFGLIGPLYAHLYRDPAPGKLMKRLAPNVHRWVERMNQESVEPNEWLAEDAIPETLMGILRQQFTDFWPIQLATVAANERWILNNPSTEILPRKVGEHAFTLGNTAENRVLLSFNQWKLQRVLDVYQNFNEAEKSEVDPLLKSLGGYDMMQVIITHRVARKNNRLVVANHQS